MTGRFDELELDQHKKDAEALGLTLQELLLFRVLQKLDDLSVRAYVEE